MQQMPTFLDQSKVLKEFLAERDEIQRLKWLESERQGFDIGKDRAIMLWITKHKARWQKQYRSK